MDEEGHDIQVPGIESVGVPIGSPDFVQSFAADKASKILADVEKVKVVSGPLIHLHLLRFCQNTRLGYLTAMFLPKSLLLALAMCNMLTMQSSRPSCSAVQNTRTEMVVLPTIGALRPWIGTPALCKQHATLAVLVSPPVRPLELQLTIRQRRISSNESVSVPNPHHEKVDRISPDPRHGAPQT